ncbi:MAG TPA: pyruvate dehydrogenase complex E1 component subunit beta [Phycisphaerae bacterium]|nr:pyruvate dehydrogenase complex E1 component subunit beta [Phycisphaerae bacterium]
MAVLQFREALREAMAEEMRRDPDVFLIGEEVAEYNGAYKVSEGMLREFGPMRVVDAPISEAGFSGLGIGAAMVGMRPIVEFMTFSFSLVAFDQVVNNAPKMAYMSGGQFQVPVVFRGISGPGQQLAATHSWSVEALYTHVPGLKVVVPTTPAEAKGLLKTAIRDNDPVIFLENESMYGNKGEVPDGDFLLPFGVADVKREGLDCTIVAWGQGCLTALAAAEHLEKEHGIRCEVIDPRTLRPLDLPAIVRSVKKTGYCVTVETGYPTCGIGAEIAALVHEHCFDDLDNHVVRVAALDVPMPYSKPLLQQVVPSVQRLADAVKKAVYFRG